MSEKNNGKYDFVNSKALFVLKIITMAFAILAVVVVVTFLLTKSITELSRKVRESKTQAAKAAARIKRFRKSRIKHILKQRKMQLKEEKKGRNKSRLDDDIDIDMDMDIDIDEINAGADLDLLGEFDNELNEIIAEE